MKNLIKFLAIPFFALFVLFSCNVEDDTPENDLFIGTYRGEILYLSNGNSVSINECSVRVVKVGDKYNFGFPSGIPDINGVEFKKDFANSSINIGGSESSYIKINAKDLKILYSKDGNTWNLTAKR